MKLNDRGLLIVISGPSGVGKGTVRSALFQMEGHDLVYSVSMTTRKPRANEVDGREYYFVTREEFESYINEGKMLEFAEFVNNYYGTPLDQVTEMLEAGKEVVLEIEVQGATQVREKMKDAVLIFIAPPSMEDLYRRLSSRGTEPPEIIQARIDKAKREIDLAYMYDYIVVNDTVENAADRIMAIIRAEHAKVERTIHKYKELLEVNNESK
ncbi:MAG TPA: guanylate kinase [Acholeplasmataceae bacterium]|jgi:guanylate kinase|nr:guanylate kinase [Acholeplasmataceae bacterium]